MQKMPFALFGEHSSSLQRESKMSKLHKPNGSPLSCVFVVDHTGKCVCTSEDTHNQHPLCGRRFIAGWMMSDYRKLVEMGKKKLATEFPFPDMEGYIESNMPLQADDLYAISDLYSDDPERHKNAIYHFANWEAGYPSSLGIQDRLAHVKSITTITD